MELIFQHQHLQVVIVIAIVMAGTIIIGKMDLLHIFTAFLRQQIPALQRVHRPVMIIVNTQMRLLTLTAGL